MALVNRILNVFILIAAIVGLLYSYLLFDRRTELRERGEKLSDTVAEVVKDLDEQSGTAYQNEVHRNEITGPDGKSKPGGTLGWPYFHDIFDPTTKSFARFDTITGQVKKQASDVRLQRDSLATAISEHAELFGREGADATDYQQIATYEEAAKSLFESLESVRQRDLAVVSKLEDTSKKMGYPLDKEAISSTDNYEDALISYGFHIGKLHERSVNYGDTLAQAVEKIDAHEFEVNVELLKDDNAYVAELTAILNDFSNINGNLKDYEKYKVEFLETKDTLEKTIEALEAANENLAALENKLTDLEADHAGLNQKYQQLVGRSVQTQSSQLKEVAGKILNVNYDWNYVVIDLGSKDNLPENLEMIVAREKEFICKVLITKVYKNHSVAEILQKSKVGNVIEGDRVIF